MFNNHDSISENMRFFLLPCGGIGVDSDTIWNEMHTYIAARTVSNDALYSSPPSYNPTSSVLLSSGFVPPLFEPLYTVPL